jgi:hypothetical protein
MADVTISQLTLGTPAGNNILPYSTGSVTLGVPVSAIFYNTPSVGIGYSTDPGNSLPSGILNLGQGAEGRALAWGSVANNYANIFASYSGGSLVLGTNTLGGINGGTSSLSGDKYYSSYNNSGTAAPARRNIIRLNAFNDNGIQFFTNPGAVLERGVEFTPLERMRINSSGNVGIGTSSPTQKLDVVGNVNVSGTITCPSIPKFAWARFNGSGVIQDSYGVTSITPTGPNSNIYIVDVTAANFSNANYSVTGMTRFNGSPCIMQLYTGEGNGTTLNPTTTRFYVTTTNYSIGQINHTNYIQVIGN